MIPNTGDVLWIDKNVSVQFVDPFLFRVSRVRDWSTYHGWVWLTGYVLDDRGDAVEQRTIYVQIEPLRPVKLQLTARPRNQRAPAPAGRNQRRAEWDAVRPEPGGNRR